MAYCENCGTKIISDSNFCSECGNKIKEVVVSQPKIKDVTKENNELDETFVKETLDSMKKFVERSSEIKDKDEIQEEDIQLLVDLGETIKSLNEIAEKRNSDKESDDGNKIDLYDVLVFIIGFVLISGAVISLIVYYPEYKENLPEWLQSIFG